MAKVSVYRPCLGEDELSALLQLLAGAGVPISAVELVNTVGPAEGECEEDVYIFLLSSQALENDAMDGEIAKVPDGGRRAICVWPQNSAAATPPESAAKFSYSIVSWNPERLRLALADDDVTCFETPMGEPLPEEDTERLECP